MILGRYRFTSLGLDTFFPKHVFTRGDRPCKVCKPPMVDLGTCDYIPLDFTRKITPKEYFIDAYVKEVFELENICDSTKRMCMILDAKN